MQRVFVLRGPSSWLNQRAELQPAAPEDLVLHASDEPPIAWAGLRALVGALVEQRGEAPVRAAMAAADLPALSLIWRGLVDELDASGRARRASLAAQAPGFLSHNFAQIGPLRRACAAALAPLLAGRRVRVPAAARLDIHSAVVLAQLARSREDVALVLGVDPAALPADPLWRREGLSTLSVLDTLAVSEIGATLAGGGEGPSGHVQEGMPVQTCPPWEDGLEARAFAALAADDLDLELVLRAIEAAWAAFGFTACLRLGLELLARAPALAPAVRRRVSLLVALSAYNRQVGSRGESPAADEALAALLAQHFEAALDGEDDLAARSHLLYRLALNEGRRRGLLPRALAHADAAVEAAAAARAPFFEGWARNGRAYVLGRQGALREAIAEVLRADALAALPIAGPLASEATMTQIVLADNLAALHAWAGDDAGALEWQARCHARAQALPEPNVPSPRWLELLLRRGELAQAQQVAETGLRIAEAVLSPIDADIFASWLGELLHRRGDAVAARRCFARAATLSRRREEAVLVSSALVASAMAALRAGALADADAELAALTDASEDRAARAEWTAARGWGAALAGDPARADELVNAAIAEAVALGERDVLLRVATTAGEACLALGRDDDARNAFAQALALADGEPPARPADRLPALAGAWASGLDVADALAPELADLDAALTDGECWWQLDRLARAAVEAGLAAPRLAARYGERLDADPAVLAALRSPAA